MVCIFIFHWVTVQAENTRIHVYASGHEKVSSGNLGSGTLADKTATHWPRPTENWWSDPRYELLDWQNSETGPKLSADLRSTVFFKSANPLDFSPKSTIRELFKAKSTDPRAYSTPSEYRTWTRLANVSIWVKFPLRNSEVFKICTKYLSFLVYNQVYNLFFVPCVLVWLYFCDETETNPCEIPARSKWHVSRERAVLQSIALPKHDTQRLFLICVKKIPSLTYML